jgi:hypothetical protein
VDQFAAVMVVLERSQVGDIGLGMQAGWHSGMALNYEYLED